MEIINIYNDQEIVLDTQSKDVQININKCRVIITDVSNSNKHIKINQGQLEYCYIKNDNDNKTVNLVVTKGYATVKIIDILENNSINNYTVDLNDEDSNVDIAVGSISSDNSKKEYVIKTNNLTPHTFTKIDCFGIVGDTSLLRYDITSFIKKGAKKSVVNQNSKILLFDKQSIGINNPVLEIEENDVKANHGSSIGMIDEETLFYLTSRGIKEEEARKLVSLGKINYIIQEIKDEKIKSDLLNKLLERV